MLHFSMRLFIFLCILLAASVSYANKPLQKTIAQLSEQYDKPEHVNKGVHTDRQKALKQEVLTHFFEWLGAWNRQDMDTYFSFYGYAFLVPNEKTKDEWTRERIQRIQGKRFQVEAIDILIDIPSEAVAVITFKQWYKTSSFTEESNKMLVLIREKSESREWKIVEERSEY
jgi:hypothetical protein